MKLSFETKALGWALLAASLSLGGALSLATPIRMLSDWALAAMASTTSSSSPGSASSSGLATEGHEFFAMSCSQCHGDDATGDEGPNLHNLAISNTRIAATIKKGIKGEMPTFEKKYNDQQIAALVAFLRSLR